MLTGSEYHLLYEIEHYEEEIQRKLNKRKWVRIAMDARQQFGFRVGTWMVEVGTGLVERYSDFSDSITQQPTLEPKY